MHIFLFLSFINLIFFGKPPEKVKVDGFPVNLWIGHKVIQKDNVYSGSVELEKNNKFDFLSYIFNLKKNKNLLFFTKLFFLLFLTKNFYYFFKKNLEKIFTLFSLIENESIILCCCYLEGNDFKNFFELDLKKIIDFPEENCYKKNCFECLNKILIFKEKLITLKNKKLFIFFYKLFFIKNNLIKILKNKQKIINNLNKFIEKIINEINLI